MTLYALQLHKEYEFFDQSFLGEIVGIFQFDYECKENKKEIISYVVSHPDKYPLIWSEMAHSITRLQRYIDPKYRDAYKLEFRQTYNELPTEFTNVLESILEISHPKKDILLEISKEDVEKILPSVLVKMKDQYNVLCNEFQLDGFYLLIRKLDNVVQMD